VSTHKGTLSTRRGALSSHKGTLSTHKGTLSTRRDALSTPSTRVQVPVWDQPTAAVMLGRQPFMGVSQVHEYPLVPCEYSEYPLSTP
jgi:hypothetical protein